MNYTYAAKTLSEPQNLITPEVVAAAKLVLHTNFLYAQQGNQSALNPTDVHRAASVVAFHHQSPQSSQYAENISTCLIPSVAVTRIVFLLTCMPQPSSTGTRSPDNCTHGGTVGIGLSMLMIFHPSMFGLHEKSHEEPVIEIGSNLGTFGVLASSAFTSKPPSARSAHLIECDLPRVMQSRKWATAYRSHKSKLEYGPRHSLSTFPIVHFDDATSPCYSEYYKLHKKPWNLFFNNYGYCMSGLETKIESELINLAPVSSVLICFSRMLLSKPVTWNEEVLHTYIPAGQLPFNRKIGNPSQQKLLVIFKYTRMSTEAEPTPHGRRRRINNYCPGRQSNVPPHGSFFVDYESFANANNGALGVFSIYDNSF